MRVPGSAEHVSRREFVRYGPLGAALTYAAASALMTSLTAGCARADDSPARPASAMASTIDDAVQGTPDGVMLSRFSNVVPFGGDREDQELTPGRIVGYDSPIRIRCPPAKGIVLTLSGDLATRYGTSEEIVLPGPLAPDVANPQGMRGMLGYSNREGFRWENPFAAPRDIDIAELTPPNGRRKSIIAYAGTLLDVKSLGPVEPYRFVNLSSISLYRMTQPEAGQKPTAQRVVTYIHPGDVHDVSIEQVKDARGKNHIICLFAGGDDYVGLNAWDDAVVRGVIHLTLSHHPASAISLFS